MHARVTYLDHAGRAQQVTVEIRRPGLFPEGREEYYAVALDTLGCGPTRDSASGAAIALVQPHASEVREVWFVPPPVAKEEPAHLPELEFVVVTRDVDGGTRKTYRTLAGARKRFQDMSGLTIQQALDETYFDSTGAGTATDIEWAAGPYPRVLRAVSPYGTAVSLTIRER